MNRRKFLASGVSGAFVLGMNPLARAQAWPERPVKRAMVSTELKRWTQVVADARIPKQ